jgi:uncharacterized membrane protein
VHEATIGRTCPIRNLPRSGWLWWAVALASGLMVLYAMAYLVLGGRMDPEVLAESRPWGIYTHAFFGALGLAVGPFQFRRTFLERYPARHRLLGKVYLIAAAMVGLSGIYMALYSFGGASTHLGFGFMGAALLLTTGPAYRCIRAFKIASHREWMIRSFAVMFAAVTFRLWLPTLVLAYSGAFTPAYQWAAWLCWVPNLLVAEWHIRRTRGQPLRTTLEFRAAQRAWR